LNKKLQDIAKLKEKLANGQQLEKNQLTKIETESKLLLELSKLQLN
jgi:uncharacterized protein with WD repeat